MESGNNEDGELLGVIKDVEAKKTVISWGRQSLSRNWFRRQSDAYRKERSVIFKEKHVGGRANSDNRWRASVATGWNRNQVMQLHM